ncbi:ABC transporter ATP-binding protein [Glutamicibacter uratoxydans]|uniref:ABC transporter ATP-binding protein n=1 Tax=Glutamicibacter uratoxydans TaxID=43667 RepID=A0A4Y4DM23_GLUUR|nr:ABC transporter ATP-binding protein [Glutamicibacter uratoxydans]GED06382.1 ABC transporter ATP-binding protein [Glutamicibacter uratoxydans]
MGVLLHEVSLSYPGTGLVIDRMSAEIEDGEFIAVLGASGCGKSSLLNIISGLLAPSAGWLEVPEDGAAFMFQDSNLLPWLSAGANVELALKLADYPKALRAQRVRELFELVQLSHAVDKKPHELSGGMRQRVALARALAQDRQVLLMDEPFAALDAITRDMLHEELRNLWEQTGKTIIFVTHNVREAIRLAGRILVLSSHPGRILETRRITDELRRNPAQAADLANELTTILRKEQRKHEHTDRT